MLKTAWSLSKARISRRIALTMLDGSEAVRTTSVIAEVGNCAIGFIHRHRVGGIQAVLLHVADDSHDRSPRALLRGIGVIETDALADRIRAGPKLARHRFTNKNSERRVLRVLRCQRTTLQQWDRHRAQIIRRDHIVIDVRIFAGPFRLAFYFYGAAIEIIADGQHARHRRGFHPGHRFDALDHPMKKEFQSGAFGYFALGSQTFMVTM